MSFGGRAHNAARKHAAEIQHSPVGKARGLGAALAVGNGIGAHARRERHGGGHGRRGEAAGRSTDGGHWKGGRDRGRHAVARKGAGERA